jgi:hypothetical protein
MVAQVINYFSLSLTDIMLLEKKGGRAFIYIKMRNANPTVGARSIMKTIFHV